MALMAALADGTHDESERVAVESLVGQLGRAAGGTGLDVAAIYQDVMQRKPDVAEVVAPLVTPQSRQLAYEAGSGRRARRRRHVAGRVGVSRPARDRAGAAGAGSAVLRGIGKRSWRRCRPSTTPSPATLRRRTRRRSTSRFSTPPSPTRRSNCCRNRWPRWPSFRCR